MTKKENNYRVRSAKVLMCPYCKNVEDHPRRNNSLGRPLKLINAQKEKDKYGVWWSQCLVCAGFYDSDLNPVLSGLGRKTRGWFRTPQCVASMTRVALEGNRKRKK